MGGEGKKKKPRKKFKIEESDLGNRNKLLRDLSFSDTSCVRKIGKSEGGIEGRGLNALRGKNMNRQVVLSIRLAEKGILSDEGG